MARDKCSLLVFGFFLLVLSCSHSQKKINKEFYVISQDEVIHYYSGNVVSEKITGSCIDSRDFNNWALIPVDSLEGLIGE